MEEIFILSHKSRVDETKKELLDKMKVQELTQDFEVKFFINMPSDFECGLIAESARNGSHYYFTGMNCFDVGDDEKIIMKYIKLSYYKIILQVIKLGE